MRAILGLTLLPPPPIPGFPEQSSVSAAVSTQEAPSPGSHGCWEQGRGCGRCWSLQTAGRLVPLPSNTLCCTLSVPPPAPRRGLRIPTAEACTCHSRPAPQIAILCLSVSYSQFHVVLRTYLFPKPSLPFLSHPQRWASVWREPAAVAGCRR